MSTFILFIRRNIKRVLAAATFGFLLILSAVLWWPRPTVADDAERLAWAAIHGDASWIVDHLWEGELRLLGWDRQHAERFLEAVVFPKMRRVKEIKVLMKGVIDHGARGVVTFEVVAEDGRRLDVSNIMTLSDNGTLTTISHLLQQAWIVERHCSPPGGEHKGEGPGFSVKSGIINDYALLRKWRYKGFLNRFEEAKLNPLDKAFDSAKSYFSSRQQP